MKHSLPSAPQQPALKWAMKTKYNVSANPQGDWDDEAQRSKGPKKRSRRKLYTVRLLGVLGIMVYGFPVLHLLETMDVMFGLV